MISATEFSALADAMFDRIVEIVDASDAVDDIELNQGVLEITCDDDSKIIINRHAPTQEIWVAAKSGGYHFKRIDAGWVDTRSGEALPRALTRVLQEQTRHAVNFPESL
jgi:CyaY protein